MFLNFNLFACFVLSQNSHISKFRIPGGWEMFNSLRFAHLFLGALMVSNKCKRGILGFRTFVYIHVSWLGQAGLLETPCVCEYGSTWPTNRTCCDHPYTQHTSDSNTCGAHAGCARPYMLDPPMALQGSAWELVHA